MITRSAEWKALVAGAPAMRDRHLRDLFEDDPGRGAEMTLDAGDLHLDDSKNRVDRPTLAMLLAVAERAGVARRAEAMFRGDRINVTEGRPVLHVALRAPRDAVIEVDGRNVVPDVHEVLDRMDDLAGRVRSGAWTGATGKRIRNVINIGIGGSDLGPAMAYRALRDVADPQLTVRFVSNVDGSDIADAVSGLDAAETLFIVSSKTNPNVQSSTSHADWIRDSGALNMKSVTILKSTFLESSG